MGNGAGRSPPPISSTFFDEKPYLPYPSDGVPASRKQDAGLRNRNRTYKRKRRRQRQCEHTRAAEGNCVAIKYTRTLCMRETLKLVTDEFFGM